MIVDLGLYGPFFLGALIMAQLGLITWLKARLTNQKNEITKLINDLAKKTDSEIKDFEFDATKAISKLEKSSSEFKDKLSAFNVHLDNFVSKKDQTYNLVMKVLNEAAQDGEGLFLVRKMKEGDYLWRVDKRDVVEMSPKKAQDA